LGDVATRKEVADDCDCAVVAESVRSTIRRSMLHIREVEPHEADKDNGTTITNYTWYFVLVV
jgi:hypothetical protein